MSIKYAILGLLSWKSSTGYDLKKIFEESQAMYWSGNNNQIYKALVQLLDEGYVTNKILHQESSPSKKLYTITEEGLLELKDWVLKNPEAPELKNTFLIQLAWADCLSDKELHDLIFRYENEIRMQIIMQEEKKRRSSISPRDEVSPNRTEREKFLWDMISDNVHKSLQGELAWVLELKKGLFDNKGLSSELLWEEVNKMDYKVINNDSKKYLECISAKTPLSTEQDALDIVALCGENDTNLLMLHGNVLSENFFRLKTGIAGAMLQKFINYYIKTAAIIPAEQTNKGKFKDMMSESNRGSHFRVFSNREEAEKWLLS